ncbi:alpha-N-acetylglucosaminidase [Isoptericola sp. CG 20/1183]|uniref:Alpha-N-acetylglucosaminidase n=1 Tax=Isoptericola halotolerans TaxID=300560 RepID=A0ABX5EJI0_9MICO|nr:MULTISPECIES: alpha-N-acetylglucosaminidase [Isoptericola]PRZ02874.1 alpha-N-acetylglucosaminidase [Isoptericola sp. CG 20/1183]PRZ09871.1 alpha-N-acetylglucosaminidase [Isoptericola halotolerans]
MSTTTPRGASEEAPWADAVRGVVRRAGGDASRVSFVEQHPGNGGVADATWTTSGGRLRISATDAVAASVGYHHHLQARGRRITWEHPSLDPPLGPDDGPSRSAHVATPFGTRYYLNLVTHAYSAAFWGWPRWEREIDWMALHGINHPYVLTAHEVVLAETLRRSGITDEEAWTWIGSAAHLPWTAAGGMHSFGGPLPASWPARRLDLARRILARTRELGMTPVLPVAGGHVPDSLAGDGADAIEWQGWRTPVLDPTGAAFRRFVTTFLETQEELLGDLGDRPVLAVDPYLESLPPTGEVETLAAAGAATWDTIAGVHPDATWLLQGWPFHYHQAFWTSERVQAYLGGVPHENLLLIDLWGEHAPMWRAGMHGRRWLWTAIHNFGGRFALFGDLHGLVRDVEELRRTRPDRLEGVGLAPEAIENNTVYYELATDSAWGETDVETWLDRFAVQRYGVTGPAADVARNAWRLLAQTLYGPGRTRSIPSPVYARPWSAAAPFAAQRVAGEALPPGGSRMSANIDAENDPAVLGDLPTVSESARLLLAIGNRAISDALARDVVELVGHVLAQGSRAHIRGILECYAAHDAAGLRRHALRLEQDLADLDTLCATRPESRVSTWIAQARRWGETVAEADVMERDARSLVSVWGHQTSGLHDYSGRHWAGLIKGLYLPRWRTWAAWLADAVDRDAEPDVAVLRQRVVALEEDWRASLGSDDVNDEPPLVVAAHVLDRLSR